jgi:hypothetical protein
MIKGHLDQQRANVRSTKPCTITDLPTTTQRTAEEIEDLKPHTNNQESAAIKTASLFADCQPATGQIFTDPTDGRFLVPSISGNQHW